MPVAGYYGKMRILIHRLGSLGDTVVALPCFYLVRQTYPEAHITVLTNAPVSQKAAPLESILENTGLIDDVIPYPMGLRNFGKLLQLHRQLRRERFDLMISLSIGRHLPSCVRDYFFFKSCGIRKIIGLPFARRDRVCLLRENGLGYEHEAERLLRRAGGTKQVDLRDPRWLDLKLTVQECTQAAHLLEKFRVKDPFIVASLGTKWPSNNWGLENWSRVFQSIGETHPDLNLVMIGSHDEREASESLLGCWKGPRANLCGQSSPRVSAAILRRASLFIGHDSGPAHLASAVGTRCIAVYSARNPPGQWFPLGEGHAILYPHTFFKPELVLDLPYQKRAIASINVDSAVFAIEQKLDKNQS